MSASAGAEIAGVPVPDWCTGSHVTAALVLAEGKTQVAAATAAGVHDRTITNWLNRPDFRDMMDALTMRTGLALRSERIRYAKRLLDELAEKGIDLKLRKSDALGVLRYVREETEGIERPALPPGATFAQSVIIGTQIVVGRDAVVTGGEPVSGGGEIVDVEPAEATTIARDE